MESSRDRYDPHSSIEKWLDVWRERRVFEAHGLTEDDAAGTQARSYVVSMYPYPSGDLHMGHGEVYSISDAIARFARMRGRNVLNPVGWDSFGLPAENAALKRNLDPREWTYDNIAIQAESFRRLGISFDWRTRLHTSDPEYYQWNQWLFLRMDEQGLAYRKAAPVNWCPVDKTVLANEQVIQGRCERCGTEVVRRDFTQWFFGTTRYAQRLLDDMDQLQGMWPEDALTMQRNWIGRSEGAYIDFRIDGRDEPARLFSTRGQTGSATTGDGVLVNSGPFDGLRKEEAIIAVTEKLSRDGLGAAAVTYRLRDWLLSRQRYWGTPIPIVHCASCGEVAVPDDQLPVRLPESGYELRPVEGQSPLASAAAWVATVCPSCGGDARRDTDTMDTFVDSSWYFLRYPDPNYTDGPFDPKGIAQWLPVDHYIGGKEHTTGHLMYARFITKVLYDMGLVPFVEPFTRLTNQGQVVMAGHAMSKSLGNLVNLQEQLARYGPDAVRVTMVFAGPPEEDIDWADVSPTGAVKWLARVWRLAGDLDPASRDADPQTGDVLLRQQVHRLIDETTHLMESTRLNVAIALSCS